MLLSGKRQNVANQVFRTRLITLFSWLRIWVHSMCNLLLHFRFLQQLIALCNSKLFKVRFVKFERMFQQMFKLISFYTASGTEISYSYISHFVQNAELH